MVQMRLMGDDPDRVRAVADKVLAVLRASGELQLGDSHELANRRGPGLRIVVDVTPSVDEEPAEEGPIQATAVRTDRPPISPQRALPPARRRRR